MNFAPDRLVCEECLDESDEDARGWIALLAEDVDGLEPMGVRPSAPSAPGLSSAIGRRARARNQLRPSDLAPGAKSED
jgi:hypothetical protein